MAKYADPAGVFEELFETHYWAVRAYVLRRAASSVVDDVVAETFLITWRRLESVGDDPLPWILGVARRLLANHYRAERRRSALLVRLQSLVGPVLVWEAPAAMSVPLAAAMTALSAPEREALLLVAWEGLDPGRAAQVAGCSSGAFRVRLHRARQRVSNALEQRSDRPSHPPIAEEAS
ncbi:MAG TPA: RNA polymerase sigma factor [Solirubrobacteraceae bacterium]|jgi:RNA polymerase sigma-70 factor (ECF subfamily)|nr:RNA polymerase sigma factor [Solirubrobacteraceae bacterium]